MLLMIVMMIEKKEVIERDSRPVFISSFVLQRPMCHIVCVIYFISWVVCDFKFFIQLLRRPLKGIISHLGEAHWSCVMRSSFILIHFLALGLCKFLSSASEAMSGSFVMWWKNFQRAGAVAHGYAWPTKHNMKNTKITFSTFKKTLTKSINMEKKTALYIRWSHCVLFGFEFRNDQGINIS